MKIIERPDGSREIEGAAQEIAEYERSRPIKVNIQGSPFVPVTYPPIVPWQETNPWPRVPHVTYCAN